MDGLCGIAYSYFNLQNWEKALYYITMAKENSKGASLTNSSLSYEVICFVHATCLKRTQNLEEASKCYQYLEDRFKKNNARDVVKLLWGLILIPLSNERKTTADHYIYLKEYLEHLYNAKIPIMDKQNLLLSRFCRNAI